jgi:hypothetical protein
MPGRATRTFWQVFRTRAAVMPLPVYVAAVLVWKFALGQSWLYSLAGVPLGLLAGGLLYCAASSVFLLRRDAARTRD